jgi:hypothetical protein
MEALVKTENLSRRFGPHVGRLIYRTRMKTLVT